MREVKAQVFFYDGKDKSTGEMLTLAEAYHEGYIEFTEDGRLSPTDECSILRLYTGLLDKNGVEIYEGDVVKQLKDGWFRSESVTFNAPEYKPYWVKYKDVEVIGNIYSNPELVK